MSTITSYTVKFRVNRREWSERIARPINRAAIVEAVKRQGVSKSTNLDATDDADWYGQVHAGMRPIGTYLIDMTSGQ